MADTPRERKVKRLSALRQERMSWLEHWRELADYVRPRQYRYLTLWTNKGWKRNNNIINNTPTRALRTMAAGMMGGITSPARPWFRLTTQDPALGEFGPVRQWLDVVQERIRDAFAGSNIYNGLHSVYELLGLFGTAALHIEEDEQDLLRAYVFPIGQFTIANSARLQVDTVYREFRMTAGQMVESFGQKACSLQIRDAYLRGNADQWFDVVHAVEPNRSKEYGKADTRGMPWASCWFEASGDPKAGFLRESGFAEFPIMVPRWNVVGEDVYGESPGMDALGDIKALQLIERRKAQIFDKIVNPPMRAPTSLMNSRASLLPGDVTYVDGNAAGQTFAPAIEINSSAAEVAEASAKEHMSRIDDTFYASLWLALINGQDDPQKTATEVTAMKEEKLVQLGPVMERLERELYKPLIDRTFGILFRAGKLPPPPREIQNQELHVEYISIMAQAQKMLGAGAVERLAGFVGNIAAVKPEVLDKIDSDKMVEEYADMLGVKTALIVPQDQVDQIRANRAKQQAQAQAAQNALVMSKGAATLSQADTGGDNALTRLMNTLPPAAQGAATGGGVQ